MMGISPGITRVLVIAILLVLATAMCYGTAVACAYYATPVFRGWGNHDGDGTPWSLNVHSDFGFDVFFLRSHAFSGTPSPRLRLEPRRAPAWIDTGVNPEPASTSIAYVAGWPIGCLRSQTGVYRGDLPEPRASMRVQRAGGWYLGDSTLIPLQPVWLPFLGQTLLIFMLLWAMTIGPSEVRRFLRRRQGRCLRCGYRMTSVRCSECGARARGSHLAAAVGSDGDRGSR